MASTKKAQKTPTKKTPASSKASASKSTSSKTSTKKTPVKNTTLKKTTDRVTKSSTPTKKQPLAKKVTALAEAAGVAEQAKLDQPAKTPKSTKSSTAHDRESSPASEIDINEALPTLAQGPETYLHRLPGELRNRIYRYIGLRSQRIQLAGHKEPALATAIPDLRDELHSIFFAENRLQVSVYSDFKVYDSEPQSYRVGPRGGKFGAGNLAIDQDSWVMKAQPDVIAIRRMCFSIHEMGGYPIADYFVNVRRDKKTNALVTRGTLHVKGPTKGLTKLALKPMVDVARYWTKVPEKKKGFTGYSLEEVKFVGLAFQSVPNAVDHLKKKQAKEQAKEQKARQANLSSKK